VGATAAAFLLLGTLLSDRLPFGRHKEPLLLGVVPAAATKSVASRSSAENGVLFILPALNARVVSVVGSFSEWEPVPLSDDDGDGIWTTEIPLPPGRYEYAFIIDGRWWGQDPSADEYIRSFGEYSSVRYVGGGGDGA
jgi:1,4-alpha-glucan branching enzyme